MEIQEIGAACSFLGNDVLQLWPWRLPDGNLLDAESPGESCAVYPKKSGPVPWLLMGANDMSSYDFSVIISSGKLSDEEFLDAADALGEAGCLDGSLGTHAEGMEMEFTRSGRSLQAAIASAIKNIEKAGFRVLRVEMEREAIQI